MRPSRRRFVRAAVVAGAGAVLGIRCARSPVEEERGTDDVPQADASMRVLILGGTAFLGPHIVERALARGHRLTLFNRGKTNPGLFPEIERIEGDRDGKLDGLRGRSWDVVVDTSGYVPRIVRMSAELLAPAVSRYVFVSTISVYADFSKPGMDENAPVAEVPDPTSEDVRAHYGGLKALCEKAAEEAMPGRVTTIRPGLIVGPMDSSDRFTYWPVRMERGGEVLAPGDGSDPTQIVDARDLAAFIVDAAEKGMTGTFNATGPAEPTTMRQMLETCRDACGPSSVLTWVPAEFLERHEVAPWRDMPAWVPAKDEPGFGLIDCSKAIAAGLSFRPIADTAKDTLVWWHTLPDDRRATMKAGLTPEREAEVLAAWKAS